MERKIIGYNSLNEQKDQLNIKRKGMILNSAVKLCEEYIKIDNRNEFKESFSKILALMLSFSKFTGTS